MAEKKRCIRCDRPIDSYARICPYCNWDQSDLSAPGTDETPQQTYVAPKERPWQRYVFMAVGGVILLVAAFALGSKIQGAKPVKGLDQADKNEAPTTTAPTRPAPHAAVTLVPMNGPDTVAVDQPITSAPAPTQTEGVPAEYQRSDATAVSSVEYAQLAARAAAEKKAKSEKRAVDPRTLTGPAYAQSPPPRRAPSQPSSSQEPAAATRPDSTPSRESTPPPRPQSEPAHIVVSTRPVPEYQPIPEIHVTETTVVRLQLTVGSDGRVKEVNVLQGIPGQTSKIISAVQSWRFRPGTENGTPVSAPFSVDLSFRGQ
ncbi:MAG: hypothetical protein NVSMB68_12340 [Thermoanaerobaculia bacterium]